jgi:hypothetical protein
VVFDNPLVQFAIGVLAVAIALNIAWCLLQPLLPALLVLGALLVLFAAIRSWRNRW